MPKTKTPTNPAEWTAADVVEIDKQGLDDEMRRKADELGIPYRLANGNDVQRSILMKLIYQHEHKGENSTGGEVDPDTVVS